MMALPTTGSLKTLHKNAGKARATITQPNSSNPLNSEGCQFGQALRQNREKLRAEQTYHSESTRSGRRRTSDRVNYNAVQPKQTLRRSLRLVEKSRSKKTNQETFSRFFSQSEPFDSDRFSKRFNDFAVSSNGISTYFSQSVSNTKCFGSSSSFKLDPVSGHNKQSHSHVKRNADSSFKLLPLNISPVPRKNTPDFTITPPSLLKSLKINVNNNFEVALFNQIKVEWATETDSQLSRGIIKAFDEINRILSGDIMGDIRDKENYARPYQSTLQTEEESDFIVLDQKIFNNNYRPLVQPHEKKHIVGDGEYTDPRRNHDQNANVPSTSTTKVWDGTFPVPRARWVYRTPEKKKNQQPRLDDRTSLRYGLIRSTTKGDVSVYRVNRQFQDQCFVGDTNNVPVNQRYFSHMGDFRRAPLLPVNNNKATTGRTERLQQQRYLKVKTSTAQDEVQHGLDRSLDLSSINAEEEFDPFLITRPTKSKSTISRQELFELKRPLDEMEVDDSTRESNFLPKKRLFTAEAAFDDDYDECIIIN